MESNFKKETNNKIELINQCIIVAEIMENNIAELDADDLYELATIMIGKENDLILKPLSSHFVLRL